MRTVRFGAELVREPQPASVPQGLPGQRRLDHATFSRSLKIFVSRFFLVPLSAMACYRRRWQGCDGSRRESVIDGRTRMAVAAVGGDRTHLQAVAYRMPGSLGVAEDAVREAWLRLSHSMLADPERLRQLDLVILDSVFASL
jgi:hypothetical protein